MSSGPPDLEDKRIEESYADAPLTRALVATAAGIPGLSWLAGVDAALTTVISRRQTERIHGFLKYLKEEVAALDAAKVDKTYFETDEGHDLMLRAIKHAAFARGEGRSRLLAKVVAKAAEHATHKVAPPESIVEALGELTEDETTLLGKLIGLRDRRFVADNIPDPGVADVEFLLKRLEARGFLHEVLSITRLVNEDEANRERQMAETEELNRTPTYTLSTLTLNLGRLLRGEPLPSKPVYQDVSVFF